jgi:hypothetical protein
LNNSKYFSALTLSSLSINTIGTVSTAAGYGKASVKLPNGTVLFISRAIFMPETQRNLLSFLDFTNAGFTLCTSGDTLLLLDKNDITRETFTSLKNGLYFTNLGLCTPPSCHATSLDHLHTSKPKTYELWHSRLGHPGQTMIRRIIGKVLDLPLTSKQIDITARCAPCIQGKFSTAPSNSTTLYEQPKFLQRIHMDICGPISPSCGPFRYFQVFVDASGTFKCAKLLSTRNKAFSNALTTLIQLKTAFPDNPVQSLRCDNAAEYTSILFEKYCEVFRNRTHLLNTPCSLPKRNGRGNY